MKSQSEDDFKLDETLKRIETMTGIKILDYEEFKFWRQLRNEIVHEHKKVSRDTLEKAKNFFSSLYDSLDEISKNALKEF